MSSRVVMKLGGDETYVECTDVMLKWQLTAAEKETDLKFDSNNRLTIITETSEL